MSNTVAPIAQDLQPFNTFGLASTAQAFVTLNDLAQLPAISALASKYPSWFVLGGGSNLVLGESIPGLVIHAALRGIRLVETRDDAWIVEAAAGECWHDFVAYCVAQGWSGLENLALIPGTVGAAPVQNIGAYGVELADRFDSLSAWDVHNARMHTLSAEECRFAYRDSLFKHEARWIITSVRLRLPRPWHAVLGYPDLQKAGELASAQAVFDAVCAIRRVKLPDPAETGNAGSFFKNPLVDAVTRDGLLAEHPGLVSYAQPDGRYKLAAGWLIDQCGWKGRSLGPAGVHDRQALVLINRGGATAADIMRLAAAIQNDVLVRYGVQLEPEPILL